MSTRRIHKLIRIDFTPLASVALLLIFFFVFLESRKRESVIPLNIPGGIMCQHGDPAHVDARLFLLANNRIGFLRYSLQGSEAEFSEIGYAKNELEAELIRMTLNHAYGAIVLITPSDESTYKNLVDMVSGINSAGDIRFSLNDYLTEGERDMLFQYEFYKSKNPTEPVSMRLNLYPKQTTNVAER